jgi:hypothetical protein
MHYTSASPRGRRVHVFICVLSCGDIPFTARDVPVHKVYYPLYDSYNSVDRILETNEDPLWFQRERQADGCFELTVLKCLKRVHDRHFWNPGVVSYAMIPRCHPVFFSIVISIVCDIDHSIASIYTHQIRIFFSKVYRVNRNIR